MADARRIIKEILSDPKIASNSNLAGRLYRDEPILLTAQRMQRYTPPRIREMRGLAKPFDPETKIFYEQGKFMEDFEDDCEFRGEVVQYFPTYQALTDAQLRGYFSWRTKVRKGAVERTSLSFAFLYIYELLNVIGVASAEDGFAALKKFWEEYREIDSQINSYVPLWLKDYIVYYNLDCSLLDGLPDAEFNQALAVLLKYKNYGVGEVFSALNSLSSYDLGKSRFFVQNPDDVKNVAVRVFMRNGAPEKLFGRVVVNSYAMFRSAVFHHRAAQKNKESREYRVGDFHTYICRNGVWSCERFVGYGMNNKKIGEILREVDYQLRERSGFKSMLKPGKMSKVLRAKIEKEIAKYEEDRRANRVPAIELDLSKLQGIRSAALAVQEKLLVDEEEEEAVSAPTVARKESLLNEAEILFVHCLLRGGDGEAFARERGLLSSVLVDSVNEKCFGVFGDTVIAGDPPEIIDDYRNGLKGMFPE